MAKRRKARGRAADAGSKISSGRDRAARPGQNATRRPQRRSPARSPLERAQAIIERAFGSRSLERQIELAEQALTLSEDCADAYTVLARLVADPRDSRKLLTEALRAAERALGPDALRAATGRFWKIPATRPYMRARLSLGQCLWAIGCRDEAVEHFAKVLELNPADDQGIHFVLIAHLLELDRHESAEELLKLYDEAVALIAFSRALLAFRRGGDSPEAKKLLDRACRINRHIVPMLLGGHTPQERPSGWSVGGIEEAELYLGDYAGGWRQTPGAITWLRGVHEGRSAKETKPPTGPTPAAKKKLTSLPQQYGTIWQASVNRASTWLREGERLVRPWSILTIDYSAHQIVGQELVPTEPTPEMLFDHLSRAMRKPLSGKSCRPSEIQVREGPLWEAVRPHLEEIEVDCIFRPELDEADYVSAQMQDLMRSEKQPPALVDAPDFHAAQGASFCAAAAEYYRRRPWHRVPADAIIQVDSPQLSEFGSGRWFAAVMGQAGQTLGLALYDNSAAFERICGDCCSAGDPLPGTSLSIMFEEAFQFPLADLAALEQHRWALAGPEAYPFVLCTEGGTEVRQVQSWELQLLEGCLRAIPDFVEQHPYAEAAPGAPPVSIAAANLKLALSWPAPAGHACGAECEHCDD